MPVRKLFRWLRAIVPSERSLHQLWPVAVRASCWACRTQIRDPMSSFFMMRREIFEKAMLQTLATGVENPTRSAHIGFTAGAPQGAPV